MISSARIISTQTVIQRLARYTAGVVFISGLGVIALIGFLDGIPFHRLWIVFLWGGVGSLFLGWAVGHAAGRLVIEIQAPKNSEDKKPDVVEEKSEDKKPDVMDEKSEDKKPDVVEKKNN